MSLDPLGLIEMEPYDLIAPPPMLEKWPEGNYPVELTVAELKAKCKKMCAEMGLGYRLTKDGDPYAVVMLIGPPVSTGNWGWKVVEESPWYDIVPFVDLTYQLLIVYKYDAYNMYKASMQDYYCDCAAESCNPYDLIVGAGVNFVWPNIESKTKIGIFEVWTEAWSQELSADGGIDVGDIAGGIIGALKK